MEFQVTTSDLGDGIAMVSVAGEADLNTAPQIKDALMQVTDGNGSASVLVDLSSTSFIDSTTLGVLVGALRRVRPNGGQIAVLCTAPNIKKVFEITLLDRVFPLVETSDAGKRVLAPGDNATET